MIKVHYSVERYRHILTPIPSRGRNRVIHKSHDQGIV